jgi:P4 family phage/plasmid primase-like protien
MNTPAAPSRPVKAPRPKVEAIPAELRKLPQWVVWRYEQRGQEWTKIPYNPGRPRCKAKAGDPSTWGTFALAWAAYRRGGFDGIGFEFSADDPYFGVDVDKCLQSGVLLSWAEDIVARLATFGDISPSGQGIKFFARGKLPEPTGTRRNGMGPDGTGALEVYDRGRFFTITGECWGDVSVIRDLPDAAFELYRMARERPAKDQGESRRREDAVSSSGPRDDDEVVRVGCSISRGFAALWGGDRGGFPSQSEADLSLCNQLAFYCGPGREEQVARLFLRSKLGERDKALANGYLDRTITKAYTGRTEYFDWAPRTRSADDRDGGGDRPKKTATAAGDDGSINEGPDDPHRLARLHLARARHIRFYRGDWLRHDGAAYRPVKDSELHSDLTGTVKREFDRLNRIALRLWEETGQSNGNGKPCQKPEVRQVTRNLVSNVTLALQSISLLPGKTEAPSWLNGKAPFPPGEVVPTRNALVHLPTRRTVRSTPEFFSTYALEFDYNAAAPEPVEWLKFLDSLWNEDRQSIDTLQQWFGYCLTPDTRQQKILALIGPKRAGKDTIARVLTHLVGAENTAGPTLSGLSSDFGLAPLIGKPLAIVSDARISGRTDAGVIVERLLTISGEGRVDIDRKYQEAWTGKLPTRFVLISNELPRLTDSSGALAGRMILLRLTRSFYGDEDLGLFDRLVPELPGIFLWACKGWERLRELGAFIQPQTGQELIEHLEELASPVLAFVRERCKTEEPGLQVECKRLFETWCEWCKSVGRKEPGTSASFARDLRAACPVVSTSQTRVDGVPTRFYKGIDLRIEF